jgi:ferredoxin
MVRHPAINPRQGKTVHGLRRYCPLLRLQIYRLRSRVPLRVLSRRGKMLYIDPTECIDCDACVSECPVEAIFYEENVPEQWRDFIALNAEMSQQCPAITEKKPPLAEAGS